MHKPRAFFLLLLAVVALAGCGGGGGLQLSGGSVPVGGRAVSGVALLPDNTAAANAPVSVRLVPTGTVLETSVTDATGRFQLQGVPTNSDVSIVVSRPPSTMLEAVIPRADLAANPMQPLDIGDVTALTTVVAAAIHLEHAPAPEDAHSIVADQKAHLMMRVHDAGYSVETQNQLITNPNSLTAQALTLIVPTANTEVAAFAATPTSDTAETALNGLLGYVRAAHKRGIHVSDANRTALINAQLAGTELAPGTIAAALQRSGVANATDVEVSAASQREHTELTALSSLGSGITAFEALVIAADVNTHGGFQLSQSALDSFVSVLLRP